MTGKGNGIEPNDKTALIARFKQGSEEAFGVLYDRHWHSVCHFASLYLKRPDEIEEVAQEVFIRLWETRETLRDDSDLDSFLFIVTRNLIFSRRRRSFNHSFYGLTVINALSDSSDAARQTEADDLARHIEKLVNGMPAQRRRVFEMSRRRYMSYREIASELGITVKTVERHINEALKHLKSHLGTLFALAWVFYDFIIRPLGG